MIIETRLRLVEETPEQILYRILKTQIEFLHYMESRGILSPSEHAARLRQLARTPNLDPVCARLVLEAMGQLRKSQPTTPELRLVG